MTPYRYHSLGSVIDLRTVYRKRGMPWCGRSALVLCDGKRYVVPAPRHTLRRIEGKPTG